MKSSLQFFASLVGVAGLSLSISLPAVAQTSPSRDGMMGGRNQPNQMSDMNRSGMMGSSYQAAVSIPANSQSQSIVAIVEESSSFELLNALIRVAALEEAGIASKLSNGEFTVFAPTDEAFAALPPNAVRALVQPQNRDLLVRILSNHIVSGAVPSSDIASLDLGSSIDLGSTPPSGEQRPNENVGAVRPETLAPDAGSDRAGTSDDRQASAPPSGELRPNENTGNVIRENLAPNADNPNQSRDRAELSQRPEQSSPGGLGSVAQGDSNMNMDMNSNMNMGMGNMGSRDDNQASEPPSGELRPNENVANVQGENLSPRGDRNSMNMNMGNMGSRDNMNMNSNMNMGMGSRDDNQASEPPSGEQRPNENVANVQGENLSPRGDRNSMSMGGSSMTNGASISTARVIGADIQASNGVIHAINRVILTPELQSELQEAIANLDSASRPAR